MTRISWDDYFMKIANVVSERSTCSRRQVGAVLVRDRQILATGYNGAPKGHNDCLELGCLRKGVPSGERHELCRATHAEQNVVAQAAYMGVKTEGSTLYCTHMPCSICAKILVNSGIVEVVFQHGYPDEYTNEILPNIRRVD